MKKSFASIVFLGMLALSLSFGATSCKKKPKDADIKAAIETVVSAYPGVAVAVTDGVATITGQVQDAAAQAALATTVAAVKGVKSVVNNTTVPAPVINPEDDVLEKALADALKDVPGVTSAVQDGKIVLQGQIAKAKWVLLKQTLDKLKSKGYDLTGLTIK